MKSGWEKLPPDDIQPEGWVLYRPEIKTLATIFFDGRYWDYKIYHEGKVIRHSIATTEKGARWNCMRLIKRFYEKEKP